MGIMVLWKSDRGLFRIGFYSLIDLRRRKIHVTSVSLSL